MCRPMYAYISGLYKRGHSSINDKSATVCVFIFVQQLAELFETVAAAAANAVDASKRALQAIL